MKKLSTRFNENNILSSKQQSKIKGGKRLDAGSNTRSKTYSLGMHLHVSAGNSEYCLEW